VVKQAHLFDDLAVPLIHGWQWFYAFLFGGLSMIIHV